MSGSMGVLQQADEERKRRRENGDERPRNPFDAFLTKCVRDCVEGSSVPAAPPTKCPDCDGTGYVELHVCLDEYENRTCESAGCPKVEHCMGCLGSGVKRD